jgi:hypothetical protein
VNYFTLGIINILMATIKDRYISAAQTPILGGVMESLCTGLSLGQRDPVSDPGPIEGVGRFGLAPRKWRKMAKFE